MNQYLGFSLIEILISLFIISMMLLGFDAVQLTSLREMKSAYYFSVATQQLTVMAEQLHAYQEGNLDKPLRSWNKQNKDVLPQGRGTITGIYPTFLLAIFWGNMPSEICYKDKIGQSGCLHMLITV